MKVTYNKEVDYLMITLRDARIRESKEVGPNVMADFDHDGNIVGFEIMDASRLVDDVHHVELTVK